jgi:hypothetical protein
MAGNVAEGVYLTVIHAIGCGRGCFFASSVKLTFSCHHQRIACWVLGLVTCSFPINSREIFRWIVLDFIYHMVDISYLSVVICPFAEHFVLIYFCNFEFSLQLC